ncbi:uncharacterized protein LOC133785164 [Humulus lupulus]|uniref:uncharacterized protein LOC133785164 n=1 Tax=Humulus lupulus TaxID=3486 RepID=UPI002B407613|nr:uncharacterized protein LOC133785164 [Humulus lupulus]
MSDGWRRSRALTAQYEKRLGEQLKASEDRHSEELKMAEVKYIERLEAAEKKNAQLLDQKAKLAEELKQHQNALTKAIENKEKYKEASLLNFKEASKLQDDLVISKKEPEGLEERIKELEETNVSNLERYKGATFKCFYSFWKHNRKVDFNYLSERMRQSEINKCLARLEKEERAKVPASLEISLATGIDGVDEEIRASVDKKIPQDPPAS